MSDKRAQVETFLGDVLAKMAFAARVEVKVLEEKPAQDGQPAIPSSLSVALFPEGELPGLTAGKRTPVVESLQFLANKVVNRGPDKQWVNVGVGAHPEPRIPGQKKEQQKKEKGKQREPAAAAPSGAAAQEAGAPGAAAGAGKKKRGRREGREEAASGGAVASSGARARDVDESSLNVPEDAAMMAAGLALAQKSAELGRIYAVTFAGPEDRGRLMKAADQVDFVRGKVEGEGRHRRVVFMPANPKPMPKKSHIPDYDEEDEDDGEE